MLWAGWAVAEGISHQPPTSHLVACDDVAMNGLTQRHSPIPPTRSPPSFAAQTPPMIPSLTLSGRTPPTLKPQNPLTGWHATWVVAVAGVAWQRPGSQSPKTHGQGGGTVRCPRGGCTCPGRGGGRGLILGGSGAGGAVIWLVSWSLVRLEPKNPTGLELC